MPDVFTKRKRSEVMARIRARGNRDTELALARLMRQRGITGWRRQQVVRLPARKRAHQIITRADFVFPRLRVAVFVDGCFWHACPMHSPPAKWLAKSAMPATATSQNAKKRKRTGKQFWREKLAANKRRDRLINRLLRRGGWCVVRIWEHEIPQGKSKQAERAERRLIQKIQTALRISRQTHHSPEGH